MVEIFNEILGKEVRIPERPVRIVSFSPAVTETLFMVGLEPNIVGVSAFCSRPSGAARKRRVGSYNTVNHDLLDELKPDLILTVTGYQREFALQLSETYPVYPLELPVSVAGIVDMVVKVGLVVNVQEKARDLSASLLRQLASVQTGKRLKVYVEIDLGGPVSFGSRSYITDAIHLHGASTVYDGSRSEWLTPDPAHVLSADPDVVIFEPKMFATFRREDLERLLEERGWEGMRAVTSGNCFLTPGPLDFLAHHGPSFVTEAMPWLGNAFREAALRL
jgi:iron complex transport system substrate-binding protein